MQPKIGVVILNYKVKELTLACIKSVFASDYPNLQIIVVDNNSQDGIENKIKNFKEIIFIQSGKNLGYTGGNNIGIKKALQEGSDLVFILNPDTEIKKDTISKLYKGLEEYKADIANPKIYFTNSDKLWFAGAIFDKANVLGSHKGVDQEDTGQFDVSSEMGSCTGAALLVRSNVFEKVGLFDERYFLYYEDADFAFRAKKMGFKIMYIPQAIVYHQNAKSTGLGSSLQDYFITRNRMLFASKFLPWRTQFALFREAIRNFSNKSRRQALSDFMLGNFGKGSFNA